VAGQTVRRATALLGTTRSVFRLAQIAHIGLPVAGRVGLDACTTWLPMVVPWGIMAAVEGLSRIFDHGMA